MVTCAQCETESPDSFRFCPGCGAPLAAAPPRQVRKVVTALFCDVTGSTALGEQLDPEVLKGVMNRYFEMLRATIERHGGTVEKFIGDAMMAVFGIPQVHEDDALRAVRAAAEIRDQLPVVADEVGVTLRFRTGVNTGPVFMGEGENMAIGDAVNVAARLEQAAAPGEIVLGTETLRLVRDAVMVEPLAPLELKGKSDRVDAFRLLSVDPIAEGFARHFDAPLVGRERDLRLLTQAWDRTLEEARCHLFTVLGTAGVGKSRLVAELLARVGDRATVLRGRCLHYGDGVTFWPLVEALISVGEPAQPVLDRLNTGGVATPEELFWEVRRLLESLAEELPVILHIDDLQWAEPMLLDLLDHVADLSRGAPLLLLCTARPELLEERPAWGGGKLNATTVLLEPLAVAESEALLANLGDDLEPRARARVIAAGDGNPLFLEEMLALAREGGTVQVPATIQAVIAARLERLGADERDLLERGAVEGEVFHRLAVRALADDRLAAVVEARLVELVRKELIRPYPATLKGDDAFRFRHLLIRDAAYDGLPKAARAELHERFAQWLEQAAVGLVELDEIAGWHLEQAAHYQHELGREVDPRLASGAAEHLHAAGRQAALRADPAAARNLLERGLALAPANHGLRTRLRLDLAEQLLPAGERGRVDELLTAAERDPDATGRTALLRLEWQHQSQPEKTIAEIKARLPGLLDEFSAAGDERGLAKAHLLAFFTHWLRSRATPAAREIRLAAEHAARAGDAGLRSQALAYYISTLVYGPTDTAGIAAELEWVEREGQGAFVQAFAEWGHSSIARMDGRLDDARRWAERARDTAAELGITLQTMGWEGVEQVERLEGNLDAALSALESCDAIYLRSGEDGYRSTVQARIAEVQAMRGDRAAAHRAIAECLALSAADDVINFAITHGVRAELALAEGDSNEAEREARRAVDFADQTDFPDVRATARLTLATVLAAAGHPDEAAGAAGSALALYEAKGDRPRRAIAQSLLDAL